MGDLIVELGLDIAAFTGPVETAIAGFDSVGVAAVTLGEQFTALDRNLAELTTLTQQNREAAVALTAADEQAAAAIAKEGSALTTTAGDFRQATAAQEPFVKGLVVMNGHIGAVTSAAPQMGQALAMGLGLPLNPQMALVQGVGMLKDVVGDSINKAGAFNQVLTNTQAVTGATDSQLKALKESAMALGVATDTGAASSQDAANAQYELAKSGMSVETITGGAAKSVIQMKNAAADAGFGYSESATLISNALNSFTRDHLSAKEAADQFVGTSNASSTGLAQLKFAFAAVGPVASSVGVSFQDTNTALGLLAQHAVVGSDAGTSLKTMFLNLNPHTKTAKDEFDALGLTVHGAGNKFFDAGGHVKNLSSIADTLKTHLAGLTDQQRMTALQTLFGTDAVRAASIIYDEGAKGVDKMAGAIHDQGDAAGTASKMSDTLKGHTEQLSSTMESLQISAGDKASGGVDKLVTALGHLAASKGAGDAISWVGARAGEAANTIGTGIDVLGSFGEYAKKADAIQNVVFADMRHNLGITSDAELEAAKKAAVAHAMWATSTEDLQRQVSTHYQAMRHNVDDEAGGMHDDLKTDFSKITSLAGLSAQDVRDMTMEQWRALHGELNTEADGITDDLGTRGYAAGNQYINSQGKGISDSEALVMNKIDALMQMYDIRGVLQHLGAESGQKFAEALALHIETALGKLQTGLAGLGNLPGMGDLGKKIAELNNSIKVSTGDMVDGTTKAHDAWIKSNQKMAASAEAEAAKSKAHMFAEAEQAKKREEAAGRSAAAHEHAAERHAAAEAKHAAAAEAAAERKAVAAEKANQREADAVLKAEQQTIASLGKAAEAGQTSGDVLVAALAGVKSAAEGNLPAVGQLWQHVADEMQSKTPPAMDAIRAEIRAGVQRLTTDPDASIAAWAKQQMDHLHALDDAATVAANKVATDTLKAQSTVITGFGQIAGEVAKGTATTGDLLVGLMEGAENAAKAHLPDVEKVYKGMLGEMQSATPPSLAVLHDQFRTSMQALAADPNASIAAWGQRQLDDLTKIDQELAAKHQKEIDDWTDKERAGAQARADARDADVAKQTAAAQSVVQGIGAAYNEIAQGGKQPLDVLLSLTPLLKQSAEANMPQVAAIIQRYLDAATHGGVVDLQALQTELKGVLDTAATAPGTLGLYARSAEDAAAATQAEAQAAAYAKQQTAEYEAEIKRAQASLGPFQQAVDQTKSALDASNKALSDAKAAASGYQGQLTEAKNALQDFQRAKLDGEGASSEAGFKNTQQQHEIELQIAQLRASGAGTNDPRIKALTAQLDQVRAAGDVIRLQAQVTFDPMHHALDQLVPQAKELTFQEAADGMKRSQGEATRLQAALDAANDRVHGAERAQQAAAAAAAQATAAYKEQQEVVKTQTEALKAQEQALKDGTVAAQNYSTQIGQAGQAVTTGLTTALTQAQTTAATGGQAIMTQLGAGLQAGASALPVAAQAAFAPLPGILTTQLGSVQTVWDLTFGSVHQSGTLLNKMFSHDPNAFYQKLDDLTDVKLGYNREEKWLGNLNILKQKVGTYLGGPMVTMANVGMTAVAKAADDGLIAELNAHSGEVQATFRAIIDAGIKAAEQEAGIASPSKRTAGIAQQMHAGFVETMRSNQDGARQAGAAYMGAAFAGAQAPVPGGGLSAGAGSAGGARTSYDTHIQQINVNVTPPVGMTPAQAATLGPPLVTSIMQEIEARKRLQVRAVGR